MAATTTTATTTTSTTTTTTRIDLAGRKAENRWSGQYADREGWCFYDGERHTSDRKPPPAGSERSCVFLVLSSWEICWSFSRLQQVEDVLPTTPNIFPMLGPPSDASFYRISVRTETSFPSWGFPLYYFPMFFVFVALLRCPRRSRLFSHDYHFVPHVDPSRKVSP